MTPPCEVTVGEAAGSRFGVVVVEAVDDADGSVRIRCSVVGRGLAVTFGGEDWELGTRPIVDRSAAADASASLQRRAGPAWGESEVVGILQRTHEVSLGMDFEAKVEALRELQALDGQLHPARDVLAAELRQAIGSELAHVLGEDVEEIVADLRTFPDPSG